MRKRSEMLKKLYGLLLLFCMLLCMALCTGVNAEAAQTVREDTMFMNIKQWRAGNASCIEFDALVNTLGSKYVDVYRSEPSVKNGGELKRLDRFQVMGAVWNVIDDDRYACYGNAQKVICYSERPSARGDNLTFLDTTTKAGHEYSYQLRYSDYVVDPEFENFGDDVRIISNTITVKPVLQTPELYKCYTTDNKIVKLSWSYTNQADGYRIYKYDNGKWSYLKAVRKGSKLTATDKTAKTGKTYQYRVLAYKNVNGKNIYSNKSAARKITLKSPTVKGDYSYGSVYGPYLDTAHLAQVRSVVQSFKLNYIRKGMSDYDKVLTAFNYLRSNCRYAYRGWQYNYANTAWGALVYGEAQCSGYARAMKALCDASGVDCRYIHANAKASNPSHQWNQVKVGGKWYILDAQSNGFLLGTNTWIKQAGMFWDTKGLPTCSKTDYKR